MPKIRNQDVMWKEQDGVVTVLRIESGKFLEFNAVGSEIWKGLAAGDSADEIVSTLAARYSLSKKQLAKDVDAFIKRMQSAQLIDM